MLRLLSGVVVLALLLLLLLCAFVCVRVQVRSPEPTTKVNVTAYHPDVDWSYTNGVGINASKHPDINERLRHELPATHPNVDKLLADPSNNPLPDWHPAISMFQRRSDPVGRVVPVSIGHPNVTAMFAAGQGIPAAHPGVHVLLQPWLPATHPGDIDGMLRDPEDYPLPHWHPKLEDLLARVSSVTSNLVHAFSSRVQVFYGHPSASASYAQGTAVPSTHPRVQPLLQGMLPPVHPNVDEMLRDPKAHPLPVRTAPARPCRTLPAAHVRCRSSPVSHSYHTLPLPSTAEPTRTIRACGFSIAPK